jgi:hypothetical protein
MVLDLDSTPTVILVKRYVLAVLYFATIGEGWGSQWDFLSALTVCELNNGFGLTNDSSYSEGALCNEDNLVVDLNICKSKHEEVIVLISKFRIDSPVYLPFYLNRW